MQVFQLRGIPPMVAGAAHVRVTFQVDADGLLSVSAMETSTGVASTVVVKPSFGLDEKEVVSMIKDSFAHAETDKEIRGLNEARVETTRMIDAILAALGVEVDELFSEQASDGLKHEVEQLKRIK